MITVKNYQDQKNNVAWSKMPKAVQDNRNDVEEIMEFYDDDTDIKETVDIFLKQINENSKPVGEIVFAKLPKVDFVEPKKVPKPKEPAKIKIFSKKTKSELKQELEKEFNNDVDEMADNYGKKKQEIEEAIGIKKAPAKTPAKTKTIKPTISKTFVDNFSIEFQLIRRFWNMVDDGVKVVPFRKVQLLFNAFNKAALERKIRKTNDVADLFTKCSDKIVKLYLEFAAPGKSDVEAILTDKTLYEEIKKYCTNVSINPAVSVLKRYISVQNTKPDVKNVESIIKAIDKVLTSDSNNRLALDLRSAKENLQEYIDNPKEFIDVEQFGLSRPATKKVCKNRVKCSGLTPNGRLKKGYRFEEDSNNVIKVVKGLGSPKVCKNRVKCAGLTSKGQLRPGYKFREDTNEVIRVTKAPAKRKPATKKTVVKKKRVVGLGFSDNVEIISSMLPIIPIVNEPVPVVPTENNTPIANDPTPVVLDAPVVKNKLMNMQFDSLDFDSGWEQFMQNPAKNMKVAIWGAPKNGKTAGSLQLANYLTKFGKVLYNFADQGFNKSTQDLWQMSGLANNAKAEPSDVQTLADLEKEVATGKYTFVFIDMISDYINKEGIKPYEFKERFMKKYPKVSFILVFEVTKGGNFKGDQGWTHIVDAIVTVENFLMENRGRYGVGSHIVWKDGLKRFNPKKYDEVIQELQPEKLSEEIERI
jgi:hypothetical protein